MSSISNLKLISAKRPQAMPAIQLRRNKLIAKLHEQIQLATALSKNETYAPRKLRNVKDRNTGEMKRLEVTMRVRQWWFVNETGKVCLQIKYGAKTIDIAKGKNAIEVDNGEHLIKVLETVKGAVQVGELDGQIESASNLVKTRFKK